MTLARPPAWAGDSLSTDNETREVQEGGTRASYDTLCSFFFFFLEGPACVRQALYH